MTHPADEPIDRLLTECEFRRQRRSGPGGQHRNKVETAVVVTHRPSGCSGEASERRSQEQNRQQAVSRLRVNLALELRTERRQYPSDRWRRRCPSGRLTVGADHEDFAALLAEGLDCLAQHGWDAAAAARQLGCSTTQLVKLLRVDHRGLEQLNARRKAADKPPLR